MFSSETLRLNLNLHIAAQILHYDTVMYIKHYDTYSTLLFALFNSEDENIFIMFAALEFEEFVFLQCLNY